MHKHRRVTGRFWVFVLLIALLAGAVLYMVRPFGSTKAVLMMAESQTSMKLDVVYIRSESVYQATQVAAIDYVAEEGTLISQGDTVLRVFTTGFTENLLTRLDTIRERIETYHEALLGNIIDTKLDALNDVVSLMAEEVRDLSHGRLEGSLYSSIRKLETAMSRRQEYMRQNQQSDSKLIQMYQEETSQLSSIASMRKTALAGSGGIVSFQLDGYEVDLTPETAPTITEQDMATVIRGGNLANTADIKSNGLFRIVDQSVWYVAAQYNGSAWTPVIDQEYGFTPEGYDDIMYSASVEYVQKMGGTVIVVFRIEQPIGPLLYRRSGKGTFSINISGYSAPKNAVQDWNGQTGIWIETAEGETFVEVDVLTSNATTAIILPKVDDALPIGQTVIVK